LGRNKISKLGLIVGLLGTLVFISGCYPTETPEGGEGGFNWTIIVFLVLIFGVMYFLMIRPQRKRQKEHEQLVEELKRGDRVVTAGGIHGVVESLSEDSVVIKIESGATMRVSRSSVVSKHEK
jgi:preprotein translocase subunit YajC